MLMVSTFIGWAAQRAFGLPLAARRCSSPWRRPASWARLVERVVIRRSIGATHWDVLIITLGLSLDAARRRRSRVDARRVPVPVVLRQPSDRARGPCGWRRCRSGIIGASLGADARRSTRCSRGRGWAAPCARSPRTSARRGSWASASSACTRARGCWRRWSAPWPACWWRRSSSSRRRWGSSSSTASRRPCIGGFGSMPGAVLGGMLLGVHREPGAALPALGRSATRCPSWSSIAILLVRPAGLLGRVEQRKV